MQIKTDKFAQAEIEKSVNKNIKDVDSLQKKFKESSTNFKKNFKVLAEKNDKQIAEIQLTAFKQHSDLYESIIEFKKENAKNLIKNDKEIKDLKKSTQENTNNIDKLINNMNAIIDQEPNKSSSPNVKTKHKCIQDANGCCEFCDTKFNELENKEIENYTKFEDLNAELEELKIAVCRIESLAQEHNNVEIINELTTQFYDLKSKICNNNVISEDKFDPEDKHMKQEMKEIKEALMSFQEILNLNEKIGYDDIKNIQELPGYYNKVEDLVTSTRFEEGMTYLEDKIDQLELSMVQDLTN